MQLICDSHHGIYCPQLTIKDLIDDIVSQLPAEDVQTVLDGPDNEFYWESWENILNTSFIIDDGENKRYYLYQDEDVWMLEKGEEFNNE